MPTLLVLNGREARTAAAVFDRLFPADEHSPAASDIGVVAYLDRALAGPYRDDVEIYRLGLGALDDAAERCCGRRFHDCAAEQRDELLEALEQGEIDDFEVPRQQAFFELLQRHLREGLFADPLHGGNREKLGWRFLEHPGVWLSSTAEEQLSAEPATRGGVIQSIEDLGPSLEKAAAAAPEMPGFDPQRGAAAPSEAADVVLVGLGAVGGLVAPILARAGLRVVALEAGPYRTAEDYVPDELRSAHYCRGEMGDKFAAEIPRWRRNVGEPTTAATFSLGRMVNGVGGSTIRYAGWLRRFHPHHFRHLSHVLERFGEEVLPEEATLADWPLTYEELEPYYTQVEYTVGVAGDDRENPFPPRSAPFPMPPLRRFRAGEAFRECCERLALHPHTVPAGVNSVPYNGLPETSYSAWSAGVGFGPFANDRWNPSLTSVPEALASGNLDLRTHCRAVRIVTDRRGRAGGVEYIDANGERRVQRAGTVILSAYTFEIVRLLLLSRDDRHLDGLGNNTGQLGRHFMAKMFSDVHGLIPGTVFNKHTGLAAQAVVVDDFLAEDLDYRELGFVGGTTLGCESQFQPIFISREPVPPDVRPWGKPYKDHLRQWQDQLAVRIQPDTLSYRSNFLDLDPHHRDRSGLGLPVLRITYDLRDNEQRLAAWAEDRATEILRQMGATKTWPGSRFTGVMSSHDLGGARMGHDPATSVVDPDLRVHDTPGLYVFGGATFPTCPGINPMLTIWAVCARAAERLAERLGAGQE